jgi:hypothetical protein
MAIEVSSGRLVVLEICEPQRLGAVSTARGVKHRHLATLLDVVVDVRPGAFPGEVDVPPGAGVAVAEHVPGRTLANALDGGPLHAAKAVAWVLRLADAVQALHAARAVHGAISPRSVLASPEGRAIAPVLSQLVAPAVGAYCPPERLRGGPEAPTDDVWALYATLYAALTGKAPFRASTRDALLREMSKKPAPLASFGVDEPALQEIVARGLSAERRGRAVELVELIGALDGWERDPKMMPPPALPPRPVPRGLGDIVSGTAFTAAQDDGIVIDDSALPDDQGRSSDAPDDDATLILKPSAPLTALSAMGSSPLAAAPSGVQAAPVPRAQAPAVAKRPSINPFERKGNVIPWAIGAAVAGGAIVYVLLPSAKTEKKSEPTTAEEAPPSPRPVAKPAVKKNPEIVRDECVVAHFSEGALDTASGFGFVCDGGDFRETVVRLHSMVRGPHDAGGDASPPDADTGSSLAQVRAAGREKDAGAEGRPLGWYELPATAIIRKTCCSAAAPITLPETPGWCEQLQTVVRRMADDSSKSVDLAPVARTFDKAVGCLYGQRVRHGYGYEKPPTPANRALFQQFLGRAAIISTRR